MSKIMAVLALWLAIWLMPLVCGLARGQGDPYGDQPPPPPEPNPIVVDVPRGHTVWITLSAFSLTSPIIRYRIRRHPEGKLGTPVIQTESTATVKYTPPAGAGPGDDDFSYQIQSEGGVSVAADVRINITDKDPLLTAPNEIDFGQVLPGRSVQRQLVIQNIGGGLAQGDVVAPDPWTVQGSAGYKLGAGEKQTFTLVFAPTEARQYTGDIQYTGELQRATDLDGVGMAPAAVSQEPVELTGSTRSGVVEIENRMDGARTFKVTVGPQLEADASLDVPGKSTAQLLVRAKPNELGAINDHVIVAGDGVSADIPIYAAAEEMGTPAPAGTPIAPAQIAAAPAGNDRPAFTPVATEMALPPVAMDSGAPVEPEPGMRIQILNIRSVGEREAQVVCNFAGTASVQTYRLEAQSVGIDAQGKPEAVWAPLRNTTVKVSGSSVSAELADLEPGALYVVRLVGIDDQGRIAAISLPAQIWTVRPKPPSRWPWVGLVAAVVAGVVVWKRIRWRR
ncbi:MAG: hypothetical protein ABSE62_11675 [Chthoniobacteraceae bacterium]